ncbi:MAG: hypothetical protein E6F99_15960 [Actinobacteria bacterium]|nr:MAG: hypothetical protein E6F99_15960 [Actinomycetota bacterium]
MVTSVPGTRATIGRSTGTRRRSVRVGHSWDASSHAAGAVATLDAIQLADPRLLLVFASFGYDLPELVAGVGSVAGDIPVIGCSTAGEIGPGPPQSPGVVVVGLGGDFSVRTTHSAGLRQDPRAVGEAVAHGLLPLPDTPHRTTLMLTDSLAGDQQEMVRGAYGLLGATVPLIGGGAGDNMRMQTSYQFHNGQILQEAVVAAVIGSDDPIGLSVRHGWRRSGHGMVVTGSAGNDVHSLDDRPALDAYLHRHAAPHGLEQDAAAFAEFALTRPLAVARRGDVAIRHVLGADPVARTLNCAGSVPKGAAAWLATGDVESTLAATDAACAEAIEQLGEVPLLALLVFDCVGRRAVLGDDGALVERRLMNDRAGTAPLAGFYTYGEIARTKGVIGYHNQTVLAVALS